VTTEQSTATLADQVRAAAPGIARVRMIPVYSDATGVGRRLIRVFLYDAAGLQSGDVAEARAVRELIRAAHPRADWSRMHAYDVALDRLSALAAPTGPRELTGGAE
jgi:hypothetical protein